MMKTKKKVTFSLIGLLVVFALICGVIVVSAKPFSEPETQIPPPENASEGENSAPSPESWHGHTVSFAAAAGYSEDGVQEILIGNGAGGQTVSVTGKDQTEAFFRIFDGVEVTSEALISAGEMQFTDSSPVRITVRYENRDHVFFLGETSLVSPYGNNAMVYLVKTPLEFDREPFVSYGFAKENKTYPIGQTLTFAEAAGITVAEIEKVDLRDGSSGREVTLRSAQEIQDFFAGLADQTVILREVAFSDGYTIGVTAYQGEKTISFSFGDEALKVPEGFAGGKAFIYQLSLPEKTSETILATYPFR